MSQLIDFYLEHNAQRGDEMALALWHPKPEQCRQLSAETFFQKVESVATGLCAQLKPGSRVLLLFEPGLEFAVAFWACLRSGMVAIPTYPPADPRTRERFLEIARDAEASLTLTTAAILKKSRVVRWLVGSLRRMRWRALEEWVQTAPADLPAVPAENLALLQYTSGSTERPRGVMLSHHNLWSNFQALEGARSHLPPEPEHFVSWLPLYHDMGLFVGVIMPQLLGYPATLLSPLHFLQQPVRWLQVMSSVRGTLAAAPNFAYELCLRRVKDEHLAELDLSSWRVALNGAENVLPSTLERFYQRFAACGLRKGVLYPCYGLAESTVFVAGNPAGSDYTTLSLEAEALSENRVLLSEAVNARQLVGLGHCWNQGKIAIVNPESLLRCAADQVGEVWISGPSVGSGYWQRLDVNERVFGAQIEGEADTGTWMRTGDMGFVHEDQLYLTGRIKEMIIVNGQNYYPQPIEMAVQEANPAFRPGNGVAFARGGNPEKLVVVQEVRQEVTTPVSELEELARAAVLKRVGLPLSEFILLPPGALPKTSSGKLQRRRCRELYLKGKLKAWKS